jgi:hypothetical protein
MRERALGVGSPTPLNGVVTEPAVFDPSRPALLIMNSGVMHHVGSCRMSVKIARQVAEGGILSVRFDFSGIGDSDPRRSTATLAEIWRRECVEVMNHLASTRGVTNFVLFGLCSGADVAYNTSLFDERVIAYAQIDGFCYPTRQYHIERYRRSLLSLGRWKTGLLRRWLKLTGRETGQRGEQVDLELPDYARVYPSRDEVAAGLRTLVARGVRIYVTFTGGEMRYNYRQQYRDSFPDVPFGDLLNVDYYPRTNHIITQREYQQEIVRGISRWVARIGEADPVPKTRAS